MIHLFLGLTFFNLICLSIAIGVGYLFGGTERGYLHLLTGALAALACCGVHCVVFTYFAATAKWIQHAVILKRLDPAYALPTRSFKAQAFPAAMAAMAIVLIAAFSGAAVDNHYIRPIWHHALAWVALGVNLAAAGFEYRAVRDNSRLIDEILEVIEHQPNLTTPLGRR